jgi:hypothetical protein
MSRTQSLDEARSQLELERSELAHLQESRLKFLELKRSVEEENKKSMSQALQTLLGAAPTLQSSYSFSGALQYGLFATGCQVLVSGPDGHVRRTVEEQDGDWNLDTGFAQSDALSLRVCETTQALASCANEVLRRVEGLKHRSADIASRAQGLSQRAHDLRDGLAKIVHVMEAGLHENEHQLDKGREDYSRIDADLTAVTEVLEGSEDIHALLQVVRLTSTLL